MEPRVKLRAFFVGACLAAAVLPGVGMIVHGKSRATAPRSAATAALGSAPDPTLAQALDPALASALPTHFRGRPLTQLPLTPLEARFAERFPGAVARFAVGSAGQAQELREVLIVRHVTQATRRLHRSSDCFRAAGYAIDHATPRVDRDGLHWRCFVATRAGRALRVCERIAPVPATREGWTDVSAWYWHALWQGPGAWQAYTWVTRI
jgi:hypothetical protein